MEKLGIIGVALMVVVFLLAPRARAAAGIQVVGQPGVQNQFPDSLVFTIDAESGAEIRDVRLRYTFVPENRPVTTQADFEPGDRVHATFTLRSNTRQLYIPPGKVIRYSWELRDAAGNELTTDEQQTSFADTRFQWQQVTDGVVNLHYYSGPERDAEVMAQVANETITKAEKLLGTTFDFPIQIWAYSSERDFQQALAHESVTSDPNVLGQAHEPDTFIMVADRLSSPTALDTARHELTHLVTAHAVSDGPFADLYPLWLNEGTSVYMQVSPNDVGYIDALQQAIHDDTVIPIRSLTGGGRVQDVGLFYGESYALVKYLIDTYGADKFAQMVATFKNVGDEDKTFQQVYGLDRAGLYREWRKSVGLNPEQASASPSGSTAQAKPSSGNDSTTIALAVGGTAALVLLGAAATAGGLVLARRRRM
jgi:hypothetical protein